MSPNVEDDLNSDVAAKELIRNLEKMRKTKTSGLEEDHNDLKNGSVESPHEVNNLSKPEAAKPFKRKIAWKMFLKLGLGHILAAWAIYPLCFEVTWAHVVYVIVLSVLVNAVGAVMASHRYYSHRAFKANIPLQIILIIFQTMCTQGSAMYWARNHRLHHKYSDTDADPHSAARGFFFSHIGWSISTKHPLVIEKIKEVNTFDLDADPIARFQRREFVPLEERIVCVDSLQERRKFAACFNYEVSANAYTFFEGGQEIKHYYKMLLFFGIFVPMLIPVYVFGDTWWNSFLISVWLRMFLVNHATFCINSWAHLYGTRPYDKSIRPSETMFVAIVASGDGWHNFHHAFPQDYRASEYGAPFNLAANIIEFFAWIGWATDLKTVSPEMIQARATRTGDVTLLRNQPALSS